MTESRKPGFLYVILVYKDPETEFGGITAFVMLIRVAGIYIFLMDLSLTSDIEMKRSAIKRFKMTMYIMWPY